MRERTKESLSSFSSRGSGGLTCKDGGFLFLCLPYYSRAEPLCRFSSTFHGANIANFGPESSFHCLPHLIYWKGDESPGWVTLSGVFSKCVGEEGKHRVSPSTLGSASSMQPTTEGRVQEWRNCLLALHLLFFPSGWTRELKTDSGPGRCISGHWSC